MPHTKWSKFSFVRKNTFLLLVALVGSMLITQASGISPCLATGSCPEPAGYGRQPYPGELVDFFERAGINRLLNNVPTLPQIYRGYPPAQLRLVSPYVPCILLKAVGYTESPGWKQFDASYNQSGNTLISDDCGYGMMQITSGMGGGSGFEPSRVAGEPAYNIGTGTQVLIQKWNSVNAYIGANNPYVVENWYYAVWAYNGWDSYNNPNRNCPDLNPDCGTAWNPIRAPFDGSQPRGWYPYQELVWGYAANPPVYQGAPFWQAALLTLPPGQSITDPPPTHIDTPQPVHGSCSVNYLPAILKDYPACVWPLQNGDFEAGSAYWTLDGGTAISPMQPRAGSYSAWFGGYNGANDTLYQSVTIPGTGPTGKPVVSAWLNYYWYMTTEETSHPYDYLYVKIRDVYGNNLTTLQTLSDGSATGTWVSSSFDVSAYVGQSIQVYFWGTTDNSYKTSFFVDDVRLSACEGG